MRAFAVVVARLAAAVLVGDRGDNRPADGVGVGPRSSMVSSPSCPTSIHPTGEWFDNLDAVVE